MAGFPGHLFVILYLIWIVIEVLGPDKRGNNSRYLFGR